MREKGERSVVKAVKDEIIHGQFSGSAEDHEDVSIDTTKTYPQNPLQKQAIFREFLLQRNTYVECPIGTVFPLKTEMLKEEEQSLSTAKKRFS